MNRQRTIDEATRVYEQQQAARSKMEVYHGCTIAEARNLSRTGILRMPGSPVGLYVTESRALALRYANARATCVVDATATELAVHAAVVTIKTDEAIAWRRRATGHRSLDLCEATILSGQIVAIEERMCDYHMCECRAAVGQQP